MVEYILRNGFMTTNTIEWARLYEDAAVRNVAVDAEPAQGLMVSTIWEGIHAGSMPGQGMPLVFSTALVIDGAVAKEWRSATEQQALLQHAEVVRQVLKREPQPEDGFLERIIEASNAG